MSLKATFIGEEWIDDHAIPNGTRFDFDISAIVRGMSEEDRDDLVKEAAGFSRKDLDFLAERAGATERHRGPFTVELEEDALKEFLSAGMPYRYVATKSLWGHIFDESVGEISTQWVYDLEEDRMISAVVASSQSVSDATFNPASDWELKDLEESIRDANGDCLISPEDWGVTFSDAVPDFASTPVSASKRKVALIAVSFDDADDDIVSTSDLATWVESAMGSSKGRRVDITVYSSLDALKSDVEAGHDPLASAIADGAIELSSEAYDEEPAVAPTSPTLGI